MPEPTQTAIRVGDDILHSESLADGIEGILIGAAVGLVVGAALVAGEVLTGGALTIFAVALLAGGMGGKLGKVIGKHSTHAKGKVLTGSPNVFIGQDKQPAARADADVGHCEDHSDSESAHDQPSVQGKKIAQGSATVLINGFYAARKGDKGTCDFTLGDGYPNVFIGGPATTVKGLEITSETSSIDGLITGMMIVGGIILAAPAVAGIAADCAGLGAKVLAQQLAARLIPQFVLGLGLSKGFGLGFGYVGGKIGGQGSLTQDVMADIGEDVGPFAGGLKIPGVGKSAYGLADGVPGLFGFKSVTAGAASGVGAATGAAATDASSAATADATSAAATDATSAAAADASGSADAADASAVQRYGGTGADPELTSTEPEQARANASYDQIRANPDDVAQISQNTGYPEDVVARSKDHLFNSQHDIFNTETGETTTGSFTPNQDFADLWNKAADGTLGKPATPPVYPWDSTVGNPDEITQFNDLLRHEYVESHLTADGIPYQSPHAWVQDAAGEWNYDPKPGSFGAHDLSPRSGSDPFGHYPNRTGLDPTGIPPPNEDLSNLDETVAGIRRALGGGAGSEGSPGSPGEPEPIADPLQQISESEGGAKGTAPPDNPNSPAQTRPTEAAPDQPIPAGPVDDPLVQIGPRDGGMPGEAPAEQPESESAGKETEATPAGEADPVVQTGNRPGGIIADTEVGPATAPGPEEASQGRLDYSRGFDADLRNFEPDATLHDGPLTQDMTLVQYHRADAALGDGRSASWWTTADQANGLSTEEHVRNALALPPDWGPRDAVSIAHIPIGTDVTYYEGTAVEQVSTQTGQVYDGGGLQYRFKNFDPSWITQTRPLPVENQ